MPLFDTIREIQELVLIEKTVTEKAISVLFEIDNEERLTRIMKLAATTSPVITLKKHAQTGFWYLQHQTKYEMNPILEME